MWSKTGWGTEGGGWSGSISGGGFGGGGGGGGPSTAYTNFAARCTAAGATLTGSDATNYQALLDGLTTDGLFNSDGTTNFFDCLYILAAPSTAVAALNLVSSSFTLGAAGSPAFVAHQGYTGVDSSSTVLLSTAFNPTTAPSPKFTRNSAHISAWPNTNITSTTTGGIVIGLSNGSSFEAAIYPKFNDGNFYARINDGTGGGGGANASSAGHFIANRDGASTEQAYKNAVNQFSNTQASAAPVSGDFQILGKFDTTLGAGLFGSSNQVSQASIGASLSSANATLFYNRLATFRTAVGL